MLTTDKLSLKTDTRRMQPGRFMFDTTRFLETHFNDADGVIGLVAKHWPTIPNREAVRKWFSRSSVASEWFPVLLIVLEAEAGSPVTLREFGQKGAQNDIFG